MIFILYIKLISFNLITHKYANMRKRHLVVIISLKNSKKFFERDL